MEYCKQEKIKKIMEIVNTLKNYPTVSGKMDIYLDKFEYVSKFKDISLKWINSNKDFSGKLYFEDIDKYFNYSFPNLKSKPVIFTLEKNSFFDK